MLLADVFTILYFIIILELTSYSLKSVCCKECAVLCWQQLRIFHVYCGF